MRECKGCRSQWKEDNPVYELFNGVHERVLVEFIDKEDNPISNDKDGVFFTAWEKRNGQVSLTSRMYLSTEEIGEVFLEVLKKFGVGDLLKVLGVEKV